MRRNFVIGAIVLLVILGGGGFWLYQRFLGATTASSGPINAAPVDSAAAGALVFQIVPDKSEARFALDEVLRGQPNRVVGKTNQVAGQIAINPDDLSATKVGVIKVSARTLETDDARRNRAIGNFILNTSTYEFITFTPTLVKGLSGKAAQGTPLTFQITGNLTIRDVTKPVTFNVTAHADSKSQLTGTATTTINRADFSLNIPNVPFVASVGDPVQIDIDFVAQAGQG